MPHDAGFTIEDIASTRPMLDVIPGEIDTLATKAEAALQTSGLPVFQRGEKIVIPVTHEVPAAHGRMTVAAGLKELSLAGMIDYLSRAACFQKPNARKKGMAPCNPTELVAKVVQSRSGQWTLSSIAGVITTPTLRPDGSILQVPGYDIATRLFHVADPELHLPMISSKLTRQDALAALALLEALIVEFPCVAETDKAVALSGLITPVLRGMIPVAPLHGIKASTPGTGKTLLVDLASTISTGRPCPVLAAGEKPEETEKRLVGVLLAGYPIVSLDNVNGELGGDLLCQAIEHPLVRVRKLCGSPIQEVESRATFFATGNGLRVRGDMTRRVVICTLDAGMEQPELRTFHADPLKTVLSDRAPYVAAAITIVRAYLAAGSPDRCKPLASFQAWSDTVRSALVWLGCQDPVATMEAAREDDPELGELKQVIGAWHAKFESTQQTVRNVAECAMETYSDDTGNWHPRFPELRDTLVQLTGEKSTINTRKLGQWLMRHEGRIVRIEVPGSGLTELQIKRAGSVCNVAVWKVYSPAKKE